MTGLTTVTLLALLSLACADGSRTERDTPSVAPSSEASGDIAMPGQPSSIRLTSAAFPPGGNMPARYTCEGDDLSPPLAWAGIPDGTTSLALIVDDPDAPDPAKPERVWVHWVLFNLPADAAGLPENATKSGLPKSAVQGKNDWGKREYGGPCPPIGRHRYFFKLYALDMTLTKLSSPTKGDLERAMQGHILGQAELIGTYQSSEGGK